MRCFEILFDRTLACHVKCCSKTKGKENSEQIIVKQYDEDMKVRQHQLMELNEFYNKELDEYRILKEYFDKADADIAISVE